MFRWIDKLIGRADALPPAAPPRRGEESRAVSPSIPAAVVPSVVTPAGSPVAPPPPNAPVVLDESTLRARYAAGIHSLVDELPDVVRRTDAPAVLARLAEDPGAELLQPPVAAQQTLAMSRREDTSVGELVGFFEQDPSLTQALLRYASSSFYGGRGDRTLSIAQAVQTIGMAGVENVVLSHIVHTSLCRPGSAYEGLVQKVWSHLVRTGPIARDLADAFDVEPERAFTLGLLHDAGKLMLFDRISAIRKESRREIEFPHHVLLWTLKRTHEALGGLAALGWGLEPDAVQAIARHHREPPPVVDDRLSGVVHLAEKIDMAHVKSVPLDLDAAWSAGRLTGDLDAVRELLEDRSAEERAA